MRRCLSPLSGFDIMLSFISIWNCHLFINSHPSLGTEQRSAFNQALLLTRKRSEWRLPAQWSGSSLVQHRSNWALSRRSLRLGPTAAVQKSQ